MTIVMGVVCSMKGNDGVGMVCLGVEKALLAEGNTMTGWTADQNSSIRSCLEAVTTAWLHGDNLHFVTMQLNGCFLLHLRHDVLGIGPPALHVVRNAPTNCWRWLLPALCESLAPLLMRSKVCLLVFLRAKLDNLAPRTGHEFGTSKGSSFTRLACKGMEGVESGRNWTDEACIRFPFPHLEYFQPLGAPELGECLRSVIITKRVRVRVRRLQCWHGPCENLLRRLQIFFLVLCQR